MPRPIVLLVTLTAILSCAPPKPVDEGALASFRQLRASRATQYQSAAYLIDLRLNTDGRKYSVTTELYFSGDSIGIYGRGLLGKSAYRGHILDDTVLIYFPTENQYFSAPLVANQRVNSCDRSGEVLLYVLSLLGRGENDTAGRNDINPAGRWAEYRDGRFDVRLRLTGTGYPQDEIRVDHTCGDSIAITYQITKDQYPFFRPREILYSNRTTNFRAKGFVREQKYNLPIPAKKFAVTIPATAARIDSL